MTDVSSMAPCTVCGRSREPDVDGLCRSCAEITPELVRDMERLHVQMSQNAADQVRRGRASRESGGVFFFVVFWALNAWMLYVDPIDFALPVLLVSFVAFVAFVLLRGLERLENKWLARPDELRCTYGHPPEQEGETP